MPKHLFNCFCLSNSEMRNNRRKRKYILIAVLETIWIKGTSLCGCQQNCQLSARGTAEGSSQKKDGHWKRKAPKCRKVSRKRQRSHFGLRRGGKPIISHTHSDKIIYTTSSLAAHTFNAPIQMQMQTHHNARSYTRSHTHGHGILPHVHLAVVFFLWALPFSHRSNYKLQHLRLTISPANLYLVTTRSSAMVFSTISFSSAISCLLVFL